MSRILIVRDADTKLALLLVYQVSACCVVHTLQFSIYASVLRNSPMIEAVI